MFRDAEPVPKAAPFQRRGSHCPCLGGNCLHRSTTDKQCSTEKDQTYIPGIELGWEKAIPLLNSGEGISPFSFWTQREKCH